MPNKKKSNLLGLFPKELLLAHRLFGFKEGGVTFVTPPFFIPLNIPFFVDIRFGWKKLMLASD